jgi:exosortase K
MMVQPPRRVELEQVPPREYIFVVDVSGSMNGFPIETAKHLMRDLVGNLRPTDSFNLLTFAGGSDLWSERSLPATPANVQAAIATLDRQQGGGGTELLAALRRAMELPREGESRARSIVLVTDGYISAEGDVFEYVRNHLDRASVFTFGIGSSVNRHLIEGVARAGLGEPFVVSDAAQAPAAAARFRRYVQYPLLTGVHVAYEGFDAYDVTPAFLPDVLAERPSLPGQVAGFARRPRRDHRHHGHRALPTRARRVGDPPDGQNRALRVWRARPSPSWPTGVASLPDGVRRRITGLASSTTCSPATRRSWPCTMVVNPSGNGVAVHRPLPLPQGVSDLAVGGVAVGDEPGLLWLAAGMFLAIGLLTLRSRARPRPREAETMYGASRDERRRVANLAVIFLALGLALSLKAFYSRAGFDELRWVVDPTVWLVGALRCRAVRAGTHHGWLSRAHRFEVVPACAGLNFMIAAYLSLCCGLAHHCARPLQRVALVLGGAAAAYAATLFANATRIVLAIRLHDAVWSWGPITPERAHLVAGVAVYSLSLIALYSAARTWPEVPWPARWWPQPDGGFTRRAVAVYVGSRCSRPPPTVPYGAAF